MAHFDCIITLIKIFHTNFSEKFRPNKMDLRKICISIGVRLNDERIISNGHNPFNKTNFSNDA